MDGFTTAWIIWIAMFGAIEGAAIFNKKSGDTLSEHFWDWFAIKDKPKGWQVRRGIAIAGLLWLLGHLGFAAI